MNHGPDDQSLDGLDSDELALRRMLHQAVQEIEPSDGTLDHLRRAVPARRARKRQATVGMAAAAIFICTAVPALVHVSNSTGASANTSNAGHSSQAQGGTGTGKGPDGGSSAVGGGSGRTESTGLSPETGDGKGTGTGTATGSADDVYPTASSVSGAPICAADQLGTATATADAADSANIVYGTFRVTNISTTSCTVGGVGSVSTVAQGAADPTKISVVNHVAGDAATGLPDPSLEVTSLVLLPGSAYDVKFAWVPSETCPTESGSSSGETSATPTPTASEDTTSSGTSGSDSGTSTQLLTEDGTVDGSVDVSHTAEAGSPTVSVTVPDACAGTVYRTGVLAAS